ncbi:MAG: hypothetical protein QM734_06190 [Cyclobacteriaceae bacterium]
MRSIVSFLFVVFLISCSAKRTAETEVQQWKEFQDFQTLIEKPFQHLKNPAMMDSITVIATVQNINAIAEGAEKLANSTIPEGLNNKGIVKDRLQKLNSDVKILAKYISEGTEDDVIGSGIYSIYTSFQDLKTVWEKKE